jgi:hypothetical protein
MTINYQNQELILKLLNTSIKDNLIFEKTSIKQFKDGKRVLQKDSKKIKLNTKKIITKIKLENNKNLLIEDYPINQLLSYSIFINQKTKLYQYRIKQDLETYISTQKVKEIFENENQIEEITIKEISTKEIIGLKFNFQFIQPKKIQDIQEYLVSEKEFNPHIINQTPIEFSDQITQIQNFTPTQKNTHFKLAKSLNIPIIPQIKNEFIIENNHNNKNENNNNNNNNKQNINVFDLTKIIEIINPLKTIETKELVPVEKTTLKRTYLDVSTTYHIKIDTKLLIEKIKDTQITSEPKEKIIHSIKNLTQTEITQNFGEYEIPLWKVHKSQNFIKIKDYSDFKEITGIEFPKINNKINNIYIQDETGDIGFLKKQYIKTRFQKTFETLTDNNIIMYKKPLDLAIKSILSKNISIIIKYQKVSEKQINRIYEYLNNLIEITIIETIKYNKLPEEISQQDKDDKNNNEKYFNSLILKLNNTFNNFLKIPKKTTLIHTTNNELKTLQKYIQNKTIQHKEIFYLCQIITESLKILNIFDNEKSKELENRFKQYFNIELFKINEKNKNQNEMIKHSKDYKFIKQIFLANKLQTKNQNNPNKKNKILIIKKQEFTNELLNENIQILNKEPKFKNHIKPNYPILKDQFKFNYKDIANQILQITPDTQNPKIKIGISETNIKKEYYITKKVYTNYKTICENEYFILLKEK